MTSKEKRKKRQQVIKRFSFRDLVYKVPLSTYFVDICKMRPNERSAEDYTAVFLNHARLYVFAEKWDIKPLEALMLYKLYAILCKYKPYEARYSDIVEVIRYTYEHTPYRKRIDGLRELVTQYMPREQTQIAESEPCLLLVEDSGPLARDLLSIMLEKLRAADL